MTTESAIPFETDSRVHIGLDVADRDRSIEFYRVLLGARPTKVRPGYAKFELADPPLNLSLIERPAGRAAAARPQSLHYGIQVKTTGDVRRMIAQLEQAGVATRTEEQTTCCYAVQTKVWATDPDGNPWEVFVVLAADAGRRSEADTACCDETDTACCDASAADCCEAGAV